MGNKNGSLQQMVYTDGSPSPLSQTCNSTADDLRRIASVDCGNGTIWAQNFTYDPFGNITTNIPSGDAGGTGGTYAAAYSPVTNQVSSGIPAPAPTYDKNGNQLISTPATLAWNAWNVPVSINSDTTATAAVYDALGRMVETTTTSGYKDFVFRPSGASLAVYTGSLTKGTVPLPGGNTAIYNSSGLAYIRHTDWLGSSRLATTWAHAVYSKEAYAPFGETYNEWAPTGTTPDRSFTGQDQDVVTGTGAQGVYDFLFRKYDPSSGRWLSPDPLGWGATNTADPQSLNRYAYVENQPLSLTDPNGLSCIWLTDGNGVSVEADNGDGLGCQAAGINPNGSDQNPDTITVTADGCSSSDPNSSACLQLAAQYLIVVAYNGGPITSPSSYTVGLAVAPNNPCANGALIAAGVNPRQNIAQANRWIAAGTLIGMQLGQPVPGALLGYAALVGTGGLQDVKNQQGPGTMQQRVDAGNINYGITCPFGAGFCQFAAGLAQTLAGHPDPNGTPQTGFDTPSDNASIRQGQAMRAAGCRG